MERPTVFKCVPLNLEWVANGKLDLKAIYRRPVRDEWTLEQKVDAEGLPIWDLTGPLPLRRHMDYVRKGFEYITLADLKSLNDVAPFLRAAGLDPHSFIMDPRSGPWNDQFYLTSQKVVDSAKMVELRKLVQEFGSKAVEASRQEHEPGYRLPAGLRDLPPGPVAEPEDAAAKEPRGRRTA